VATVLVVDDEFGILQVLTDILTEHGHEVLTAINGRQALDVLKSSILKGNRVDVVLSDYMMPTLDGPALVRAMMADAELEPIPVILMSSLPVGQVMETMGGLRHFLRKPFRLTTVLQTIATALEDRVGKS
jgi:CheY-like chemotaxis protein